MKIGNYVARKRERLNDGVRKIGNRVCSGLGDVLASDISPRRALSVGLVGLAIGGSVANSGCAAVVGGVVGHKLAKRGDKGREVRNDDSMKGPVVPYDVDFLAYYRIKDLKTGEVEIVEGRYTKLSIDFHEKHEDAWGEKYPNGYRAELIEGGRLVAQMKWNPNRK